MNKANSIYIANLRHGRLISFFRNLESIKREKTEIAELDKFNSELNLAHDIDSDSKVIVDYLKNEVTVFENAENFWNYFKGEAPYFAERSFYGEILKRNKSNDNFKSTKELNHYVLNVLPDYIAIEANKQTGSKHTKSFDYELFYDKFSGRRSDIVEQNNTAYFPNKNTTFDEWQQKAEVIENIPISHSRSRAIYKLHNNIILIEDDVMPYNIFLKPHTESRLDINIETTKENKALLKKYNGEIDENFGYTDEGFGIPLFKSTENAFNFTKEQGGNYNN
ncbi:MAG: hypothetical protein WCT77_14180 [Bacteroidota bacterium]